MLVNHGDGDGAWTKNEGAMSVSYYLDYIDREFLNN